jgi:hypothetical protein
MNEDVGVTLISPPTTTSTSTTVASKVSTAPPVTTTQKPRHPVILETSPNTATAAARTPTISAFTGAPITSEVIFAAILIGAGCALLVGARLFRRRHTHAA